MKKCNHKSEGTLVRIDRTVNKYVCSICNIYFHRPKNYSNKYPAQYKMYICNVPRCQQGGVDRRTRPSGDLPVWWCENHKLNS